MSLLTTDFIRTHGLAELCERYKIQAKRHGVYPNIVQLKYSQIDSPMGDPIVQECRGLILNESDDWAVVSFPFRKFFNYGEGHAAAIDWGTATVCEKLDGSLMTLYPLLSERGTIHWEVASSGLPDAGGPTGGRYSGTFAGLFWETWINLDYTLPRWDFHASFMFELMTPHNRIVCRQERPRLVLIGVRSLEPPMLELDPAPYAERYGWECARSFPLATLDDCVTAAAALNPADAEGYVVRDAAFNRIKVKSPQYVALAHMKEGFNLRRLLEIVRANESSEFIAHFPEFQADYDRVRVAFDALCADVDLDRAALADIEDRKAYALRAVKCRCSSALFAMKDGKFKAAREYFAACTMAGLERVIGVDLDTPAPSAPAPVGGGGNRAEGAK
jgi:hypothetical protein